MTDEVGETDLATWGGLASESPGTFVRDGVVSKPGGPWVSTVRALLRHLEEVGFAGASRVVGDALSAAGRLQVTWVAGDSPHPGPWQDDQVHHVGSLLRELHLATDQFVLPPAPLWKEWWLREVRPSDSEARLVIGHGDAAPWNLVRDGEGRLALVDWEYAGPVDALTELAYATWLNAQLHDDDVAERQGLADAATRMEQARAILDGYELPTTSRPQLVDRMIEVAVHGARAEAVSACVTPDSTEAVAVDGYPVLWAITWRARSASWMLRHRRLLIDTLTAETLAASARGPRRPAVHDDPDQRPRWRIDGILRVLRAQCGQRLGRLLVVEGHDLRSSVGAHPPQGRPVVGVVVDQDADPWMGGDVGQTAQPGRRLRLAVHNAPQHVVGLVILVASDLRVVRWEDEDDRDEVGGSVGARRGQTRDAGSGETGSGPGSVGPRRHVGQSSGSTSPVTAGSTASDSASRGSGGGVPPHSGQSDL